MVIHNGVVVFSSFKYEPLSDTRERELVVKAQNGCKKSMDLLVRSKILLIKHIAENKQSRGVPMEDLISEGCIGLLEGIKRFKVSNKDIKLGSYCSWWIKNRINRSFVNQSRGINYPEAAVSSLKKFVQYSKDRGHQELDPKKISKAIDVPETIVNAMMMFCNGETSMDTPIYDKMTLHDTMHSNDPDYADFDMKEFVEYFLSQCTPSESKWLKMYHYDGMNLKDIAQHHMGDRPKTKQRLSMVFKEIIEKMNAQFDKKDILSLIDDN
jgi:RNA polymerase sigma factor (sigma-70 family)